MKRALLLASLCVAAAATPARAWDTQIKSTLTETLELNNNVLLSRVPKGWMEGAYTYFKTEMQARAPTMQFFLDGDVTYRRQFGPDVVGTALAETLGNQIHSRFEAFGKMPNEKTYADLSWQRRNIAAAVLDELGLPISTKGDIYTTRALIGFDRAPTRRDTFNWTARAAIFDYYPSSAGTRYGDYAGNGRWTHRFSPVLAANIFSEFEWLDYENLAATNIAMIRHTAGFEYQASPRLSLRVNAGLVEMHTDYGRPGALAAGATPSGWSLAFIGDALLTYRLRPTTDVSLTLARTVAPNVLGSIVETNSVNGTLTHRINYAWTATLNAGGSRQVYSNSTIDFITATGALNYQIARDWSASLTYRYMNRHTVSVLPGAVVIDPVTGVPIPVGSLGTRGDSHAVLASLTWSYVVLPFGR